MTAKTIEMTVQALQPLTERVVRGEAEVHQLAARVEDATRGVTVLQGQVHGLRSDFAEFKQSTEKDRNLLHEKLDRIGKPNTPAILGVLAILLTALGLIGGVLAYAINQPHIITNQTQDRKLAELQSVMETLVKEDHQFQLQIARERGGADARLSLLEEDRKARMMILSESKK